MDARIEGNKARCGRQGCGVILGLFKDVEVMGRYGKPTGEYKYYFDLDPAFSRHDDAGVAVWRLAPSRKWRRAVGEQTIRRFTPSKRAMLPASGEGRPFTSPHTFCPTDLPIRVECPACRRVNNIAGGAGPAPLPDRLTNE